MRSTLRVLTVGILLAALLALPAAGLAGASKDPLPGPISGPQVTLPGGNVVVGPSLVPGATLGVVGITDAYAYTSNSSATVVNVNGNPVFWEYNSTGADILASLRLPAGATLWQIDVYGYTTGATSQSWFLLDQNVSTGADTVAALPATSTGAGVVHATQSYPGGLTLAVGHEWMLALVATSAASGYVGAVFQYTLPTLSFVPLTPIRILDSRYGTGLSGPFSSHVARTFQVTGVGGVPAGAKAVTGNLTVTQQTDLGFLFIGPIAMNNPTSSTLNFPVGDDRANGVTVALGAGGTLSVTYAAPIYGPTAHVIFDVTGYYQ